MAKKKKESTEDKLINIQAQQLAAQVANWAAQLDFAKERFRLLELPEFQFASQLEIDRLAFEKAKDTWQRAYQESTLTGTYQGQPTIEWLTQQAQLTGVLNGQQTLQGKLTDAQIAQMNEQMRLANESFLVNTTGYYQGRPTWEREQFMTEQTGFAGGLPTLARQQLEANLTGYYGGAPTLERQRFAAEQTQSYLNLLSSLQGPGNAFKQLRVLGATPGGLQDLVSSWAGQYNLPGFGSTGSPGQAQISDLWAGMGPGTAYGSGQGSVPGGMPPGGMAQPGYPQFPGQYPSAPVMPGPPPAAPPPAGPTPPATPISPPPQPGEQIPGRGFTPDQWNDATRQAVLAWNAAHPGWIADGSQQGYRSATPEELAAPPPIQGNDGRWIDPGSLQAQPGSPAPIDPGLVEMPTVGIEDRQLLTGGLQMQGGAPVPVDPGLIEMPTGGMEYRPPPGSPFVTYGGGYAPVYGDSYKEATGIAGYGQGGATYSPMGAQAPVGSYNYAATQQGHTQVYPPGVPAPPQQEEVSSQTPMSYAQANQLLTNPVPGMGGSGFMSPFDEAGNLYNPGPLKEGSSAPGLLPHQINAENYQNTNPYAQEVMWAWFEDQGWDKQAAKAEFERSLPTYGGPAMGTITR